MGRIKELLKTSGNLREKNSRQEFGFDEKFMKCVTNN